MGQHDLSYRHFFTHRRMIQGLLREIVGEGWVERIDLASGERVSNSFVSDIDRWNRELREKSLQEGRQEGEARLLLRLLRLKFGPLNTEIEDRVRSADADRLLEWGERLLGAESLQDVFGG